MTHIQSPSHGQSITCDAQGVLHVPDQPIVAFIEGDGVGVDISPVMRRVVDAAVAKAYGDARAIAWMEVFAGDKAAQLYGADQRLPAETLEALRAHPVSIKGPLAIAPGGQSLNVALRQQLDLYVCLRPVQYLDGVPSPLKEPQRTNIAVFRENSEDIYAGIEFAAGSPQAQRLVALLRDELGAPPMRFPQTSGLGIKPISREGTQRLVRKAIQYAIDHDRPSVTLVHKGNIMRSTEGAFRDWGYALAREAFGGELIDEGPWVRVPNPRTGRFITVRDCLMDTFLQQSLLRPAEFSVVATSNLNGDYISDALAAQVGGVGVVPGANMSDTVAMFEVTHDAEPKYAGKDYANPSSALLAAELMLRHIGWSEAADVLMAALRKAVLSKQVTHDFARLMQGATQVSCSGFGGVVIAMMDEA